MRFKPDRSLADLVRAELIDYDRRAAEIDRLPPEDPIRQAHIEKNALIDAAAQAALADCLAPNLAAIIRDDVKNGTGYAYTQMVFCGSQSYKAYKRRMIWSIAHALRLI